MCYTSKYSSWLVLATAFILNGCARDTKEASTVTTDSGSVQQVPRSADTTNEYAITLNGKRIALRAGEDEAGIDGILGEPDSTSSKVLGDGADTHTGATITTHYYKGLKLTSYTPKSKKRGWIMSMDVTGGNYASARGVKVGDNVSRVKQLYPDGGVFPDGRNDKMRYAWYITDQGDYLTLKFEIAGDSVKEILLYHELP
jgi:hypothetical protein